MPVRIELDRPPQTIDGAHVSAEVEISQADDELPVREEWIARAQADGLCDIRLGLPRSSQAELHEPGVDVRLHKIAVEANGELKLTERPVRHALGEQQRAIAEIHRSAVRRQRQRLRHCLLRRGDLLGAVVRCEYDDFLDVSIGEAEKRSHIPVIEGKRGLEKTAGFPYAAQGQRLVPYGATSHGEIDGIPTLGALARRPPAFRCDKL